MSNAHAANLQLALDWLKNLIGGCLKLHFKQTESVEFSPLNLYSGESPLAAFMEQHQPSMEEFVLLLLALVPHLQPQFFSQIIAEHLPDGGDFQ